MTPEAYWTPELIEHIQTMRAAQDFSAPQQEKLAALLEAAGCPEAKVVKDFRDGLKPWYAAREIALLLGGEYAEAAWAMDAVAEEAADYTNRDPDCDFQWCVQAFAAVNRGDGTTEVPVDVEYRSIAARQAVWAAFARMTGARLATTSLVFPFRSPVEEFGCPDC